MSPIPPTGSVTEMFSLETATLLRANRFIVTNSFTSASVSGFLVGYALLTVFVNGIPSASIVMAVVSVPPNQRPTLDNPIPDQNFTCGYASSFTFAVNTFSDPDAGQVLLYGEQFAAGSRVRRTDAHLQRHTDCRGNQLRVGHSDRQRRTDIEH